MIDLSFARVVLAVAPVVAGCLMASQASAADELVWFGTYTRGTESKGIYVARFDTETGKLGEPILAGEVANPSFLARHP